MAKDHYEKDYDDEVYEDDYYDKNYDEEELGEEHDLIEDETREFVSDEEEEEDEEEEFEDDLIDEEESSDWESEKKIAVSFACEDCDYRWDDLIIKKDGELDEEAEEIDVICPMCGSMNVTLI